MKRVSSILLLGVCCSLVLSGGEVWGSLEHVGIGARPVSMGGSYVSIADDANAIFFNPSGLANISRPEITTTYARLFPNIEDNLSQGLVGYVQPMGTLGTIGLGWQSLMSDFWDGNIVTLSYARKLLKNMALGANVKAMRWDADLPAGDPLGSSLSSTSFGVDAGVLWSPLWNITVGAFVKNLNQPDVASGEQSPAGGTAPESKLPAEIHLGLAYRFPTMTVSAEFVDNDGKQRLLVGGERKLADTGLSLRLGGNWNSLEGNGELGQGSIGLGYKIAKIAVDYSYIYYAQLSDTGGAHRISVGYKF